MDAGPWVALGGLLVGILVGERAPGAASAPALLGSAALAAAWVHRGRGRVALAAVGLALVGAAVAARAVDGLERSPLAEPVAVGRPIRVQGVLASDPSGPRFVADALVRVSTFAAAEGGPTRAGGGRLVLVQTSGDEAGRLRVLAAGDRVVLTGRSGPLAGRERRWRWRHAVGRLADARLEAFAPPSGLPMAAANRIRAVVVRGAAPLPGVDRGLLLGFLLGDTRALPAPVADDFRGAGLTHLLAVSGSNVAFVLALARPLLGRLPLGARLAAGLTLLALFALVTRWEPSVLRATVMAAGAMGAAWIGRPAAAGRLLALAATVLLLADPFLVHSVAFALSCGASAGIVAGARPITARLPGPRWCREPLGVTLAAQAGVAPVLVPVFGGMPAVTPLANLLAVPVAEPLSVYGSVACALGGVVPAVAPLLALPTRLLLEWVRLVAHTGAAMPLRVGPAGLLGALAAAALVGAWRLARAPAARG